VLDEGVDVPEADLGIMVSANRGRRQVVQRLGRVIGFRVWRCTSRSRKLISAAADLITRLKPDLRHDGSRPSIVPEASPVAGSGRREASIPDRHSSRAHSLQRGTDPGPPQHRQHRGQTQRLTRTRPLIPRDPSCSSGVVKWS
jgi:hypothetical protein